MIVTLKLFPDCAKAMGSNGDTNAANSELYDVVLRFGVELTPLHPGNDDSELCSYFEINVPDADIGERIAAEIRECPSVDAAYLKPQDELT